MCYWHDARGIAASFVCYHSNQLGTSTKNCIEGFHSQLRKAFPAGTPALAVLLQFLASHLAMAISQFPPTTSGEIPTSYVRSLETNRQNAIHDERFAPDSFSTRLVVHLS